MNECGLSVLATSQVFAIFDVDGNGSIDVKEFLLALISLRKPSTTDEEEKDAAQLYFSVFDLNEDGHICKEGNNESFLTLCSFFSHLFSLSILFNFPQPVVEMVTICMHKYFMHGDFLAFLGFGCRLPFARWSWSCILGRQNRY